MAFMFISYRQLKSLRRFRWVHCQIETLRRCFPPSIRRILGELPETLDKTYERTLLEIDAEKRTYAHRLFQCLVISIRPLYVEELSELFAVVPETESTPELNIGWRPEDPAEFILSACSTLVTVVDADAHDDKKAVQFSHFSVREYLTSDRIVNSAPVSHFHILPRPAHTLLARACLSVLLQLDHAADQTNIQSFPLARYAAKHWVDHAQFEDISSDIRDGMDRLFERDKPHFAAWVRVYDVDGYDAWNSEDEDGNDGKFDIKDITPTYPKRPHAVPLYYATLCGFRDLAERLLASYPQDLNDQGGVRGAPFNAALHNGHLNTALLLLGHGADGESGGKACQTGLYLASSRGYAEIVRTLIDRGADLSAQCDDRDDDREAMVKWTPLHVASKNGRLEIARMLLEDGANVNYQGDRCRRPLNIASFCGYTDLVQLLLDHGADPNASDGLGEIALHWASFKGPFEIVKLLLKRGANVDVPCRDDAGMTGLTPLLCAAAGGQPEIVELLLDYGADVKVKTEEGTGVSWTALHLAVYYEHPQVVKVLLECGADPHALTKEGETPFQLAKSSRWDGPDAIRAQIMNLLSERTGESE